IEVGPKGLRVVRGSPVTIQAATSGAIPKYLELKVQSGTNDRGERLGEEKIAMENLGDGKFKAAIARLEKTIRYRVASGEFSSPVYTAEAIDPPEIGNLQISLYPPAYTGLGSVSVPGEHRGAQGFDPPHRRLDHQRDRE